MNNSNTSGKLYTAYVVRDSNTRRFLKQRTYTGRARGIWGSIGESTIFYTREKAQSCASNINSRRPDRFSAYHAEVREIEIFGQGTQSK